MHRRELAHLLYLTIPTIVRRHVYVHHLLFAQHLLISQPRARRRMLHRNVRGKWRRRRMRMSSGLQTAHEPHVPAHLREHVAKLVSSTQCTGSSEAA
jgi:hypothetical protein